MREGGSPFSLVPNKFPLCSHVPREYFFDLGVFSSLKRAFVPVFPVLSSLCSHVSKTLMALFPETPGGGGGGGGGGGKGAHKCRLFV